jgi:2-polyprenyl-3-methyl-5-hydroxy-6-metoxy-1,4-benzoquinol methylase
MSLGPAFRRLMPPAMERTMAGIYRSIFVDLSKVAGRLAASLPNDARIIDIGGGDGELLNHLLDLRPDVHVTMVDVAASVGKFVRPEHAGRVRFEPNTPIERHAAGAAGRYDAALVSDVVHHLSPAYRPQFFRALHDALVENGSIYIKDVEPGYFISWLSLVCDKYISGDRGVVLVSQQDLRDLANEHLPGHVATEIGLFERDRPNYIVQVVFASRGAQA